MGIIALLIAIVSFGLCFIVWVVPIFGPAAVVILSLMALVFAVASIIGNTNYNKKIVYLQQDALPKRNTVNIIAIIISIVSLTVAIFFLFLQVCIAYNFEEPVSVDTFFDTTSQSVTTGQLGVAYEIEDNIYFTLNSVETTDNKATISYSISNNSNQDGVIYMNNFYYSSTQNIDEEIYPYKNTLTPLTISANAVYVDEQVTIEVNGTPTSIGYTSISNDSVVIPV